MNTTTATPTIARVEATPWDDQCGNSGIAVDIIWDGVDRPNTGGWIVKDQRTVRRLTAAIEAGAAVTNVRVATDVTGQTYAQFDRHVMAKYMNADLRRLGY